MLDYLRIALYFLLAVLGFFMIQAWNQDHPPVAAPVQPAATTSRYAAPAVNLPANAATTTAAQPAVNVPTTVSTGTIVTVQTDLLTAKVDTLGGDIVEIQLHKYPESLNSKTPFVLLNDDDKTRYIAESGLLSQVGPDTLNAQANYQSLNTNYDLQPSQSTITVPLTWEQNGVKVIKTLTFSRNSYEINVDYTIANQGSTPWQGRFYSQLMRTNNLPEHHTGMMNLSTYFGAAISTPNKPFEKIAFKDMDKQALSRTVTGGWTAMIQHYFVSAWIPSAKSTNNFYSQVTPNGLYTIGSMSEPLTVAPGASANTGAKLYVGPAIAERLEHAAPGLKLTIDYGMFWFISVAIFWMMQKIYDVVGNWGWSIVLVTIIIKILFYQLSAKSFRSMSAMKKLQPKIEALKQRHGDDKQKMTQATLDLYKTEKVNPMGGCLPMLVQVPVFIALYWVLVESVQLRQAPWILWIHDLSQADPYYILPLLMGASMFLQQRLNPPAPDPMQQKMMMLMPVIFTVLFANFPAGLMLYWFVNNSLSFLQQWWIMRSMDKAVAK